jgi:ribonuclease HI
VASDGSGQILTERSETIGPATNNVAEYRALLLGIRLAKELEAEEVELVGDSQLIVRQVQKKYKVKNEDLKPLHAKVLDELRAFEKWSINVVRREQNEEADRLVNEALDAS